MPESAAESALWMTQAKRNFEVGLPSLVHWFTLVPVWPFLGAAPARRGFLDFCGNRSAWFLQGTFS